MNVDIAQPAPHTPSPVPMRRRLSSQKVIFLLSSIMALLMTSYVMISPLFPRRFNEFGAGVEALGISTLAFALTSALSAPFMGALADRYGRRRLVLGSLAAYLAAYIGFLLAPSAGALILLRGFAGAFTAGLVPAVTGLATDLAPIDRRAQWIGYVIGGASFGWVAGPIAGGLVYDQWGYNAALIVSIVMAIITLFIAFLAVPENRPALDRSFPDATYSASHAPHKNIQEYLFNLRSTLPNSLAGFLLLLFISFAVLFAWAFIEPRFMFYAYNDLGWSSSMLGLAMSTYGIAMVFGEFAFGQASDRLGRKPVIILGLVLFSAQFIGLAFFKNYLAIAVAFVIGGLGNALYDPALSASILDISPHEHRSRILGIKSMVASSGTILGSALIALVNSSSEARSIFLISVGVVLLTTLIGLGYPARERHPKEHTSPDADRIDAGAGEQTCGQLLTVDPDIQSY